MKNIYILFILAAIVVNSACNDEWKDEQYEHYASFKAPVGDTGVTQIYVRYKPEGVVTYELPLIVSGSIVNTKDLTVHVAVDSDTLRTLNYERYQNRTDLYYEELTSQYFRIPETVNIPSGQDVAVMNVDFTLKDIDLVYKWVLPLTILDDPFYNYVANQRKHYRKALLRVMPFNDYSGSYSATAIKIYLKGAEDDEAAIVQNEVMTYVVDDNTIFFYAGTVNEDDVNRKNYKIQASFDETTKVVTFTADDPNIDFLSNRTTMYYIEEMMDETRPYLLHKYITISNIDYNYSDYTSVPGAKIEYTVRGSLIMERQINTQIPDEDQAIQW